MQAMWWQLFITFWQNALLRAFLIRTMTSQQCKINICYSLRVNNKRFLLIVSLFLTSKRGKAMKKFTSPDKAIRTLKNYHVISRSRANVFSCVRSLRTFSTRRSRAQTKQLVIVSCKYEQIQLYLRFYGNSNRWLFTEMKRKHFFRIKWSLWNSFQVTT